MGHNPIRRALAVIFPEWPGWWEVFNPRQPWFLVMVVAALNFGLGLAIVVGGVR